MTNTGLSHVQLLRSRFPNIQNSAAITSPPTPVYNCIAYAAGYLRRWWWPDAMGFGYWPPSVIRLPTLPVFQSAFETLGFNLCPDDSFDSELEKIAIFHRNSIPTHAAKLIGEGVWSSKLGKWFDISHSKVCLDDNSPGRYGEIAFLMSKPVS